MAKIFQYLNYSTIFLKDKFNILENIPLIYSKINSIERGNKLENVYSLFFGFINVRYFLNQNNLNRIPNDLEIFLKEIKRKE